MFDICMEVQESSINPKDQNLAFCFCDIFLFCLCVCLEMGLPSPHYLSFMLYFVLTVCMANTTYYKISYLARSGFVETELSEPSMHQASMMIKECPSWSSCSLSMNGETMLLGWNGVPLRSVSAWKFQQDY